MTRDSYVPRAVSIHGDKYGYDRVPSEFRATDKIEIFCNDCKEYFTCTARNHTNSKSGCPRCGRKKANSKISSTFFHSENLLQGLVIVPALACTPSLTIII